MFCWNGTLPAPATYYRLPLADSNADGNRRNNRIVPQPLLNPVVANKAAS